jgi:hypothetical protein
MSNSETPPPEAVDPHAEPENIQLSATGVVIPDDPDTSDG